MKIRTNICLTPELVKELRKRQINISKVCEIALWKELKGENMVIDLLERNKKLSRTLDSIDKLLEKYYNG